jgi:hypothetical protein
MTSLAACRCTLCVTFAPGLPHYSLQAASSAAEATLDFAVLVITCSACTTRAFGLIVTAMKRLRWSTLGISASGGAVR